VGNVVIILKILHSHRLVRLTPQLTGGASRISRAGRRQGAVRSNSLFGGPGESTYVFRWKHTVPLATSIPTRTTAGVQAEQRASSRNSHASNALALIDCGHHEKSRKISAGRS
jgi:hypothetical protein